MTESVLPEESQTPVAEAEEALLKAVEEAPPDPPPAPVSLTASIARDWRALTSISGLRKLYDIPLYQNAIYLMLNSVTYAVSGFIFWMIAARFYSDADVGRAAGLIAAVTLLSQISNLGLGFALIRFIPTREKDAVPLINSALTTGGIASVVVSLAFLAGLRVWSPELLFVWDHPVFVAAFLAFTAAFTLYNLLNQVFAAKRQTRPAFYHALAASLLRFPLCFVLASLFTAFGIFASFGVAIAVSVAMSLYLFLPRIQSLYRPRLGINPSLISRMMAHFAGANYLANLLWACPSLLFPIVVLNMLGPEMNAYFYIGWAIATLLFAIPAAIASSLFAEGSYGAEQLWRNAFRAIKLNLLLLIPATSLVLLLGKPVLGIFGPAYAGQATALLAILTLSVFPLAVNHLIISLLRVTSNLKGILVLSLFMALISIGLPCFFMPHHGIVGVGIGWLTGQSVTAVAGTAYVLISVRRIRVARRLPSRRSVSKVNGIA